MGIGLALFFAATLSMTSCGDVSAPEQPASEQSGYQGWEVYEPSPTPENVVVIPTRPPAVAYIPTTIPATIPAPTVVPTATQEPSATPTPSPLPTAKPEPTATATPIPTETPTSAPTATATPSPVPTATATPVPTSTPTPVPTATATPSPDPTATATPIPTATATPEPTATPIPTATPVPTLADYHNTQNTRWLSRAHPAEANRILSFSWAIDGLSDAEKRLVDELIYPGFPILGVFRLNGQSKPILPATARRWPFRHPAVASTADAMPTQTAISSKEVGDLSHYDQPLSQVIRQQCDARREKWERPCL